MREKHWSNGRGGRGEEGGEGGFRVMVTTRWEGDNGKRRLEDGRVERGEVRVGKICEGGREAQVGEGKVAQPAASRNAALRS